MRPSPGAARAVQALQVASLQVACVALLPRAPTRSAPAAPPCGQTGRRGARSCARAGALAEMRALCAAPAHSHARSTCAPYTIRRVGGRCGRTRGAAWLLHTRAAIRRFGVRARARSPPLSSARGSGERGLAPPRRLVAPVSSSSRLPQRSPCPRTPERAPARVRLARSRPTGARLAPAAAAPAGAARTHARCAPRAPRGMRARARVAPLPRPLTGVVHVLGGSDQRPLCSVCPRFQHFARVFPTSPRACVAPLSSPPALFLRRALFAHLYAPQLHHGDERDGAVRRGERRVHERLLPAGARALGGAAADGPHGSAARRRPRAAGGCCGGGSRVRAGGRVGARGARARALPARVARAARRERASSRAS